MKRDWTALPADYTRLLRRRWLTLAVLTAVLAGLVLFSLTSGSSGLTVGQVIHTLLGRGTAQEEAIVLYYRCPGPPPPWR